MSAYAATWLNLRSIMPGERSQARRAHTSCFPFCRILEKAGGHEGKRLPAAEWRGGGTHWDGTWGTFEGRGFCMWNVW